MSKLIVKDKSVQDLVRKQVVLSLREILSDPDFGLKLTAATSKRLKKSVNSYNKGLYKSFDEIVEQYS